MALNAEQIVLVGLPGAGKTTVGAILAEKLGWKYVDLDELIERETGRSVYQIFESDGEEEFRQMETELTDRLSSEKQLVLSVGGGWIIHNRLNGAVGVWLEIDPYDAYLRVAEDATVRPLLQPDPLVRMKELLSERGVFYARAEIHIDTSGKTPAAVAEEVAAAVEEHVKEK